MYFPLRAEAPEYQRRILDALREPLESGELVLHRAAGTATYPARFQLVLAANPCPCGQATGKGIDCHCSAQQRRRYFDRMSAPLLDRVDLQLAVHRVALQDFSGTATADSSAAVATRVAAARAAQHERLSKWELSTNAEVPAPLLHNELRLTRKATVSVDKKMERAAITKRGYDRVLRVAWTIADLTGRSSPNADDVTTALLFRAQEEAA
ncbi:hypothetical protein GCM10027404_07440 [Arthrobacter tumbae]|uniref:ATP-binding protein n=1 Tax=Arthrobacter tumbae TaxID=163874 RepID=UPI001956D4E1|nr:ATP-binding protein [Arthrobacter tumbae]MBM7783298.1 magnesium chelatase family protein [Arthrobacter tumbae]